jgi:hypothetical protein
MHASDSKYTPKKKNALSVTAFIAKACGDHARTVRYGSVEWDSLVQKYVKAVR